MRRKGSDNLLRPDTSQSTQTISRSPSTPVHGGGARASVGTSSVRKPQILRPANVHDQFSDELDFLRERKGRQSERRSGKGNRHRGGQTSHELSTAHLREVAQKSLSSLESFVGFWDKTTKLGRKLIVGEFVARYRSDLIPALDKPFGAGASLLLTRILSWLRLTYLSHFEVPLQLHAVSVFLRSNERRRFVQELVMCGGLMTLLDIISSERMHTAPWMLENHDTADLSSSLANTTKAMAADTATASLLAQSTSNATDSRDKQQKNEKEEEEHLRQWLKQVEETQIVALQLVLAVAHTGLEYKELICEHRGVSSIVVCLKQLTSSKALDVAKRVLITLGSGNRRYLSVVHEELLRVFKDTETQDNLKYMTGVARVRGSSGHSLAKRYAAQALLTLLESQSMTQDAALAVAKSGVSEEARGAAISALRSQLATAQHQREALEADERYVDFVAHLFHDGDSRVHDAATALLLHLARMHNLEAAVVREMVLLIQAGTARTAHENSSDEPGKGSGAKGSAFVPHAPPAACAARVLATLVKAQRQSADFIMQTHPSVLWRLLQEIHAVTGNFEMQQAASMAIYHLAQANAEAAAEAKRFMGSDLYNRFMRAPRNLHHFLLEQNTDQGQTAKQRKLVTSTKAPVTQGRKASVSASPKNHTALESKMGDPRVVLVVQPLEFVEDIRLTDQERLRNQRVAVRMRNLRAKEAAMMSPQDLTKTVSDPESKRRGARPRTPAVDPDDTILYRPFFVRASYTDAPPIFSQRVNLGGEEGGHSLDHIDGEKTGAEPTSLLQQLVTESASIGIEDAADYGAARRRWAQAESVIPTCEVLDHGNLVERNAYDGREGKDKEKDKKHSNERSKHVKPQKFSVANVIERAMGLQRQGSAKGGDTNSPKRVQTFDSDDSGIPQIRMSDLTPRTSKRATRHHLFDNVFAGAQDELVVDDDLILRDMHKHARRESEMAELAEVTAAAAAAKAAARTTLRKRSTIVKRMSDRSDRSGGSVTDSSTDGPGRAGSPMFAHLSATPREHSPLLSDRRRIRLESPNSSRPTSPVRG